MLLDRFGLDDPHVDGVDVGVVGVRLHQERRPVELDRRVVVLGFFTVGDGSAKNTIAVERAQL